MYETASALKRRYFGYFQHAEDINPTYDPGPDAPCPICGTVLAGKPVRTTSLLINALPHEEPAVSIFYRVHTPCSDLLNEAGRHAMERLLLEIWYGE